MTSRLQQALALLNVSLALIPAAAFPIVLPIEAEDFTECYDVAGALIKVVPEGSCSGGYMVVGLDSPGEWTRYEFQVGASETCEVSLLCQGDQGVNYLLQLVVGTEIPGDEKTLDFSFRGHGYG
jgi:hypothetical protein